MLPNGGEPLNPSKKSIVSIELSETVFNIFKQRGKKSASVLLLSGGGQNGAFGAGFLNGWSETGTRPEFDIVTGVSTGAMISTFAFLGTKEDDKILRDTWLNIKQDDIYKEGGLLKLAAGGNALYDTKPLRHLLDKTITPDIIRRVAIEYDKGRRLFVSITNLDYNQTWVWDLTAVAKHGGDNARELYINVVLASASPPILFPPVEINGFLFADGGTRHNLLIIGLARSTRQIFEAMGEEYTGQKLNGDFYVLMHSKANEKTVAIREDVRDLLNRSVRIMIETSTADTLLRSYFVTKLHGLNFNVVQIPEELDIGDNNLAFDPTTMQSMYESGSKLSKQVDPWQHQPPPTDEIGQWFLDEASRRLHK
jgi:predicted patatin/cPLA2 family phospholipase